MISVLSPASSVKYDLSPGVLLQKVGILVVMRNSSIRNLYQAACLLDDRHNLDNWKTPSLLDFPHILLLPGCYG